MAIYNLISTVTVGSGGAASIEFTSIPQTYTDLVLKHSIRTNRALMVDGVNVSFNGSTSNFTSRRIFGDGSSVGSDTPIRQIGLANGDSSTANIFGNTQAYIPNYTGSNYKSWSLEAVMEDNATYGRNDLMACLWSDTSAITSITLTPTIGTIILQYSSASLYGISNS